MLDVLAAVVEDFDVVADAVVVDAVDPSEQGEEEEESFGVTKMGKDQELVELKKSKFDVNLLRVLSHPRFQSDNKRGNFSIRIFPNA